MCKVAKGCRLDQRKKLWTQTFQGCEWTDGTATGGKEDASFLSFLSVMVEWHLSGRFFPLLSDSPSVLRVGLHFRANQVDSANQATFGLDAAPAEGESRCQVQGMLHAPHLRLPMLQARPPPPIF
ncbi:uncharacterized protein CCOS01_16221 [Colletotrichum costaricense]|uniref:Uncharacterized protein n=1 Tax=Colletotrichum costaricense TaxID=1209916 RepID=A0AAJ0DSX2_9PEZI|nr:uncharacterized protein CCOS01_16221 [Colletotrichum costaricense]KAK1507915.1 hypothetical protein CCOS01_16221 [Colletotrichum costaricense]